MENGETAGTPSDSESVESVMSAIAEINDSLARLKEQAGSSSGSGNRKGSFRRAGRNASLQEAMASENRGGEEASLREKLGRCRSDNERLRRKNTELGGELARTRAKLDAVTEELRKACKESEALKRAAIPFKDGASMKSKVDELTAANAALTEELERLRAELDDGKGRILPVAEAPVVSRISETELRSDLFDCPRYDARLSRDGRRITLRADVEGRVRCSGGVLSIPSLPDLIGFDGPADYQVTLDDGLMVIRIR
jgi:predicted RNase H-like nuclease (RuvC/YqgF family)